jgi:hypothetical protein
MTIRPAVFNDQLRIVSTSATTWALTAPLVWTGTKGDTFVVPTGFVTDFATVPRALVWKTLPYGPYTRAAVLHDWLLVSLAEWWNEYQNGGPDGRGNPEMALPAWQPPATSRDADGIFRRVMEDLGVSWLTRWQMWAAVRLAACFNSRRAYGRGFGKDAPAVLGMLLLSVPFVLPGLIGVTISLALSWPFTKLRGRSPART